MSLFFAEKKRLSAAQLKTIAIIGMTLDHIGIIFYEHLSLEWRCLLFALGGLTFPIMAYLIGEGYRKTRSFKKYAQRLFVFALAAQGPFFLMASTQGNVIFTLFFGLITIHLYETMKNRSLFTFIFLLITLGSSVLDWGVIGVPMILLYYRLKEEWQRLIIPYLIPLCLIAIPELVLMILNQQFNMLPTIIFVLVGCTLTIPLLYQYNGEKGKSIKYFFYLYYPLHILIIVGIKYLLF